MGYRSDVGITLYRKDYEDMKDEAAKLGDKNIIAFVDNFEIHKTEDADIIQLEMSWVKWYEDFPEVQFVENFLKNKAYRMLRIGEELEDIEEYSGKEIEEAYSMWIDRKIHFSDNKFSLGL